MPNTNLQLNINICQTNNCKIIKLYDTTGEYNVSTSPYSWVTGVGPESSKLSNVLRVRLSIIQPDDTVVNLDSSNGSLTLLTPLPSADEEVYLSLNSLILKGTSGLPLDDGKYTFTYTIDGLYVSGLIDINFSTSITKSFYLTCQTSCCVDKLFHLASQETNCGSCKKEKLNTALTAQTYLKSAEYAAACGKFNMAEEELSKAQWICSTKNCNNC
jgi:hypothetical protein